MRFRQSGVDHTGLSLERSPGGSRFSTRRPSGFAIAEAEYPISIQYGGPIGTVVAGQFRPARAIGLPDPTLEVPKVTGGDSRSHGNERGWDNGTALLNREGTSCGKWRPHRSKYQNPENVPDLICPSPLECSDDSRRALRPPSTKRSRPRDVPVPGVSRAGLFRSEFAEKIAPLSSEWPPC